MPARCSRGWTRPSPPPTWARMPARCANYQAQVERMQAEVEDKPFAYTGLDPNLSLQAAIYAQRKSQYNFTLEDYKQKADSLIQTIARANSDAAGLPRSAACGRKASSRCAATGEVQVGSRLNTLAAMDNRAEMARYLAYAQEQAAGRATDLAAVIAERDGFVQSGTPTLPTSWPRR